MCSVSDGEEFQRKNKAENNQVCYRKEKMQTSLIKRSERFEGMGRLQSHGPETACLALFFFFGGISHALWELSPLSGMEARALQ